MTLQACARQYGSEDDGKVGIKIDRLGAEGVFNLAQSLVVDSYVQKLDLTSAGLTAAVAKILGKSLGRNAVISTVNVSHNSKLGGQGVAAILANGSPSLLELICACCSVQDSGCAAVAEALEANSHLQRLSLGSNGITARGAKLLAIGPDPVDEADRKLGGLAANKALTALDVDQNCMCALGASCLIQNATEPLSFLNCSFCDIGDLGAPLVAEALEACPSNLSTLCLRSNDLTSRSAERLGAALSHNTSLTVLDVSFNTCFGSESVAALVKNATWVLRELRCTNCGVGNDMTGPLMEALQTNNFYLTDLFADGAEGSPMLLQLLARNAIVRSTGPWAVTLEALGDAAALLAMLRSVGDNCPSGDVYLLQRELRNRLEHSGISESTNLLQAAALCAQKRLEECLPPTAGRKVQAMNWVESYTRKPLCPVDGLPMMWARVRSDSNSGGQTPPLSSKGSVLVIGCRFGLHELPTRVECLHRNGWHVHECHVDSPEDPGYDRQRAAQQVMDEIRHRRPRALLVASTAGLSMLELWQPHYNCKLPVVMVNVHRKLLKLPPAVAVVYCHGSRDQKFLWTAEQAVSLANSADPKRHMLYYDCDRQWMPVPSLQRLGDGHDMLSLADSGLLNHLLDAVVATSEGQEPVPPEVYVIESWTRLLSCKRRAAEERLGYTPCAVLNYWKNHELTQLRDRTDGEEGDLFEVVPDSQEFAAVSDIFFEQPSEISAGTTGAAPGWSSSKVVSIQRIDTGKRWESIQTKFFAVQTELVMQGVPLDAAGCGRWLFRCPQQPAIAGADAWRCYARDGYRAAEHIFGHAPPGESQVFLSLVMTGFSCLASPEAIDDAVVLPFRVPRHRYDSTVSSMSNPEFFMVEGLEVDLPAYLITFSS